MFLDIQIDFIILKTFDQKFTLTTKKSLHIIFKAKNLSLVMDLAMDSLAKPWTLGRLAVI